jgi:putative hydrolase of the HAD superfamily
MRARISCYNWKGGRTTMTVPLILFDLDGTLVDSDAAERSAITGWIHDAGFPADVAGTPSDVLWRRISDDAFPDYVAGRTTFHEQRRLRVRRFLPLMGVDVTSLSDVDLDAWFDQYRRRYEAAWRPFPDVAGCLTRVAATHRVAVLTNGDQGQQEDKMRRTGLHHLVEQVIAASTLGVAKPDPAAFHAALARLGAQPASTRYVGDDLDVDARGAVAAGLRGTWINRTGSVADPGDIPTITTLASLP